MLNMVLEATRDAWWSSTCPPTVSVPASFASCAPMALAQDTDRNHTATMVESRIGGASLVTSDRPTGLRQSSPVVCSR